VLQFQLNGASPQPQNHFDIGAPIHLNTHLTLTTGGFKPMAFLRRNIPPCSLLSLLFLSLFAINSAVPAAAQDNNKQTADQVSEDLSIRPIFVTSRIFQMSAKTGSYQELNDQVFKMSTDKLADHDQWVQNLKKVYPEFELGLLRTDVKKVFRTSKPGIISLVKQPDGRDIEVQLFGAQSPGDGTIPGTTLIAELGLHFPNAQTNKPVSFGIRSLEVESGKTYFFAVPTLKLAPSDYVKFVRPTAPAESLEGQDLYLLFAFSVDLDKTYQPPRYIDERQSLDIQAQATKKPVPEVPASLREAGLGGNIRVKVDVSPEGKVSAAIVQYSGFPEMNAKAVESAKEWEFPQTLFETDKTPITCFITFSFPAQPPVRKAPASNSEK